MKIKEELAKLKDIDVYSLMLFAMFKLRDIPEYASLSEMVYILDKDSLLKLCEYFGDYHWYLRQNPDGRYEFVASYRTPTHNGEFIEGSGKTPRESILGRYQNRIKFQFIGWLE